MAVPFDNIPTEEYPSPPIAGGPTYPSTNPTPIITGRGTGRLLYDKFLFNETKFTDLKYTGDSFNGANTSEPLIQKPISTVRIGRIASPRAIAEENQKRISKLFNTTGRGYKFIQNQKNLTNSNTRIESLNTSSKLRFTTLALYDPNITLAQIGRDPAAQGEHYTRFGLSPFMDETLKYYNVVTRNNTPGETTSNNRLIKLNKDLQTGVGPISRLTDFKSTLRNAVTGIADLFNLATGISNLLGGNDKINKITDKINNVSRVSSQYLSPYIDQYQGGPGSVNNIGFTTIRRFDVTNDLSKTDKIKQLAAANIKTVRNLLTTNEEGGNKGTLQITPLFQKAGGDIGQSGLLRNEIKQNVYSTNPVPTNTEIVNKLKTLEKIKQTQLLPPSNTYVVSKNDPINIKNGNRISWKRTSGKTGLAAELAAAFDPNSVFNGKVNAYDDYGIEDTSNDDRMPIRFIIIDPFKGTEEKTYSFSAYLNGFRDNIAPNHTEISYIGRSEHFYVYNKFKRDVSFNFQIPCYNLSDLKGKHTSLAALYSSAMGKYNGNKLGGILYKLKVGNYLNNEAGIITNISYDIPNDSPWDIDAQLSQNINVSVSFTVIHNRLPQYRPDGSLFTINNTWLDKFNQAKQSETGKQLSKTAAQLNVGVDKTGNILPSKADNPKIGNSSPSRSTSGMIGGANQ